MGDERTFPPPVINLWIRHHTVSTDALVEELRWWADCLERLAQPGQEVRWHDPALIDGKVSAKSDHSDGPGSPQWEAECEEFGCTDPDHSSR